MSITISVPGGVTLEFPDGTPESVIRAAVQRAAGGPSPAAHQDPGPDPHRAFIADALLGSSPLDPIINKRHELESIRQRGDINAPGTTSTAEPPGPLSRFVADHGMGPGGAALNGLAPGTHAAYPLAEGLDLAGASLGQSVIKPAVGLYSRVVSAVNPDPWIAGDTRQAAGEIRDYLDEGFQGTRERFLEAHPTGMGPAVALSTEFAAQAAPFAPGVAGATARIGELGANAAGRLAPGLFETGTIGARMVEHGVGGAAFGGILGLGNADPRAPWSDQLREVGASAALGGLMGGLGGAREVAQLGHEGRLQEDGRILPSPSGPASPPPPPPEIRDQILDSFAQDRQMAQQMAVATLPPEVLSRPDAAHSVATATDAAERDVATRWHGVFAEAGFRGDERLATVADALQSSKASAVQAPPLRPAEELHGMFFGSETPEQQHFREFAEAHGHTPESLPESLFHAYYDKGWTEAPAEGRTYLTGPVPGGVELNLFGRTFTFGGGRTADAEAGFINFGRKKPAGPADPFEQVVAHGDTTPARTALQVLQATADRVTDEFLNKEDAPVRRLRRAGMADVAEQVELMQARARGAAGMVEPGKVAGPLTEGTYLFDPALDLGNGRVGPGSRRTGDGLAAILGGSDAPLVRDLNDFMAARHHVELVDRQQQAQLQYDWNRAQRLEEMRQARLADRDSLRNMFTDIRQARAGEGAATRRLGAAEATARVREAIVRQEQAHANDIGDRLENVRERTLDTAQASADDSANLIEASRQTREAAAAARDLLRRELAAAVRTPRRGEIPPLDLAAGPRSPGAVYEADRMAMALRSVAEQAGVTDGALHELLLRGNELEALHRQGGRDVEAAEGRAGTAWQRLGEVLPEHRQAREAMTHSIGSAQRVAMGIRDVAARYRVPVAERPPDLNLDIDAAGTALADSKLNELRARYGQDPAGRIAQLTDLAGEVHEQPDGSFKATGVLDWSIRSVLMPLREAGRLAPEEFDYHPDGQGSYSYSGRILDKNRSYAPFFRLMDVLGGDPEILQGTTKGNPINRISGGLSPERPIAPPLESFVQQAQRVTVWAERQRVRNIFADAVDLSPELQAEIKQMPASQGANELPVHVRGTFPAWRNGQRTDYAAPTDVILAFERLTPKQAPFVVQIAQQAARILRTGATLTPEFAFRNLPRDQSTAAAYGAQYHYRPFVEPVMGLWDLVMGDRGKNYSREWRVNGGAISGAISNQRPMIQAAMEDAIGGGSFGSRTARRFKAENAVGKLFFPVMFPMEAFSEVMESATRVGSYRRARTKGASPLDAARFSREVTLDFRRSGRFAQEWNGVEAFANAGLQDAYGFVRSMRQRPVATTASALAYLTIPAVLNWWKWHDDPDYQALPEWERAAFYHIGKTSDPSNPLTAAVDAAGMPPSKAPRWWRLPRPLGLLNLGFSYGAEKFLNMVADKDPDAARTFAEQIVQQTPAQYIPRPGNLDWIPTVGQPIAEVAAGPGGWSTFRDGPIVPQGLQGLLPEDQALDSTSRLARGIGAATGSSPLKIEYLLQGYGGGWGRTISQISGTGQPPLPATAADVPGLRGFVSGPAVGFGSDPVSKFYQLSTAASQANQSASDALDKGDSVRYLQIIREHPEAMLTEALLDTRDDLNELRTSRNLIARAEGMTPSQRADALLSIDMAATQLAGSMMHGAAGYLRGQR